MHCNTAYTMYRNAASCGIIEANVLTIPCIDLIWRHRFCTSINGASLHSYAVRCSYGSHPRLSLGWCRNMSKESTPINSIYIQPTPAPNPLYWVCELGRDNPTMFLAGIGKPGYYASPKGIDLKGGKEHPQRFGRLTPAPVYGAPHWGPTSAVVVPDQ